MKAYLLHRDRDFERDARLPPNEQALAQDLGLDVLLEAMSGGDEYLHSVARRVVLASLDEPEEIRYRQRVLQDCIDHPEVARQVYDVAVAALERERHIWHSVFDTPSYVLHRSLEVLEATMGGLHALRRIAGAHGGELRSDGFRAFFAMVERELDDEYLATVDDHLRRLRFPHGMLLSARLGKGNKGIGYVLRKPHPASRAWWQELRRWLPFQRPSPFTLVIDPRDEGGHRALAALRDRGIDDVANALTQAAEHVLSFFTMVRFEVGFYLACLALRERLEAKDAPLCFPIPAAAGTRELSFRGLYDVALSLRVREPLVGNDVEADGRSLVMVTGANQGGKSTFLRSLGLAQLMMQCGMFVGARELRADARRGLFTHFKREEDVAMTAGKLEEELLRASEIVDRLGSASVVLFNESFAATNEREGAEIAEAVVRALVERGVKVVFVTHSYELAHRISEGRSPETLFLRAERLPDGTRTFRQIEGEPLPTSFGADLYERVFGGAATIGT